MNTSKGWYNTVLQINNKLESRTKSDHSHPLDLLLKEQTNTLIQLFNDCEFVGFPKTDPEAETIVSNVLANVQNSLSDKMGFRVQSPFFNLYLGLCYLEKVLQLIKQEYENNLNTTLKHLESIIYNSNDYQNLVEVSRNIGRRVINEQQHPEFGKLKEHIAEQLEYIERTNKIEKTLPPQQTEKPKPELNEALISFSSTEIIDSLHNELKGYFQGKEAELKRALQGKQLQEFLLFPHNQNKFVEVFKRLKYNGFLLSTPKETKNWICATFTYQFQKGNKKEVRNFNTSTVHDILTKDKGEPTKKERICIVDWLPYKSHLTRQREAEKESI